MQPSIKAQCQQNVCVLFYTDFSQLTDVCVSFSHPETATEESMPARQLKSTVFILLSRKWKMSGTVPY